MRKCNERLITYKLSQQQKKRACSRPMLATIIRLHPRFPLDPLPPVHPPLPSLHPLTLAVLRPVPLFAALEALVRAALAATFHPLFPRHPLVGSLCPTHQATTTVLLQLHVQSHVVLARCRQWPTEPRLYVNSALVMASNFHIQNLYDRHLYRKQSSDTL